MISNKLFLSLFIFTIVLGVKSQTNFEKNNVLSFADYLYKENDFYRAITEYKRALYYMDDNDSVLFKIGLCERGRGNYSVAIKLFQNLIRNSESIAEKSLEQAAFCFYLSGDYRKSIDIIDNVQKPELYILKGWNYIKLMNLNKAKSTFGKLIESDVEYKRKLTEFTDLLEIENYPNKKSPVLSGLLSVFIPGLGKIYCGRYSDGIYSFIINSCLGIATYNAFENNNKTRKIVIGGASAVFYIGNVYGSYLCAKVVNRDRKNDYINNLKRNFPVNLTELFTVRF